MKTSTHVSILGISALLMLQPALADTIHMKNGDHISGKVTAMASNKLTVKTPYGVLAINWSEVANLSTDASTEIMLADKTLLAGKLSGSSPGTLNITSAEIVQSNPIELTRVSYINPPPEITGRGIAFHARANVGAARSSGNTETQMFTWTPRL